MTQQTGTETEDQLLEAATHLFKEKGYHSTSMQQLAEAVGMQKGSLYYYIDSKEELLRRLMERATSFMTNQIDEIYGTDLPPAKKLRWALENHAVTMMENLDLVAVYLREYRNLPQHRLAEALAVRKHYEQVLMQIVEDGIGCGEFRSVNVKMAVFGMLGMLNWTHQWFSPDGQFSSQEVAATLAELAMHGLTRQPDS
jgi:AcrR family transcriptional regulator